MQLLFTRDRRQILAAPVSPLSPGPKHFMSPSGAQSRPLGDATAKEQKSPDVKDNAGGLNEEKSK